MSLTAAASGFVVFLLSVQVIQAQNDWGVTYTSTEICAVKGSTVEIKCTYSYPSTIHERDTTVEETFWFTKLSGTKPVDVRTDSQYAGRVQYSCYEKSCTLRITDLRERDSAEYKFSFITNQPGGSYTGWPGVTLSVTGLQVARLYYGWKELICSSSCRLPDQTSYIWYESGQNIQSDRSPYYSFLNFNYADSYSCAVKGHEDFPSPPVCLLGEICIRVTYTDRKICAFKGSSVDISCTYISFGNITSKFWFSPERIHQWQSPSQPEDLSEDSQYAGRVQVLERERRGEERRGRSTLRITNLTERDSAKYHFKFITQGFAWGSSFPGTTLTVTALQVQVTKVTVHQSYTEAELKCHSSCSPAAHFSYVWFKNGQKVMGKETSSYTDDFYPGDNISCAFKGHEDYRSPSLYPSVLPSVSVSPSGEIVEGSSVTLSCRIDANQSAKTAWYKENLCLGSSGIYRFLSISSEDRGIYHCKSEDQHSVSLFIDVQYAPHHPSVSVSPSAEIEEGSSVTLTCSSDANPAANYTWYKENEDSPKASGQNFTITNFSAEHSGNYYCEAQNTIGRHNSTSHLIIVAVSPLSPPNDPIETVELKSGPDHINVSALNSVTAAQTEDTEEQEHSV